tara:strand:+ start:330 stop:497 length:168 start_codon:yes stop_codon:yes gene_type:complete
MQLIPGPMKCSRNGIGPGISTMTGRLQCWSGPVGVKLQAASSKQQAPSNKLDKKK